MKKILYLFLAVSFIFTACKKDDDNTSITGNTGNAIAELEQIIQGGENICSWKVQFMTQQHREGYFGPNGEKIYTDAGNLPEPDTITIDNNTIFTFYDTGDSVDISSDSFTGSALEFSDQVTYEVTGPNQVEFMGDSWYDLQIYTVWEISNKTDSRIETYYDDFYPNPNSTSVDSFNCDQGHLILEKIL